MTFEEFEKDINNSEAYITAKINENGKMSLKMRGNNIYLLAMSMSIAEDLVNDDFMSIEQYCNALKEGYSIHKELHDKKKKTEELKKFLEDLFDE